MTLRQRRHVTDEIKEMQMVPRRFAFVAGERHSRAASIFRDRAVEALDPDAVASEEKAIARG
jgi:hypothetical protein